MLTRRRWLILTLKFLGGAGLLRFTLTPLHASASLSSSSLPSRSPIGKTFAFEFMKFAAGFFLFSHAGDAEISLVPTHSPGRYRAKIWGKTRGLIGFITRHREDTHISEIMENEEKNRFICTRLIRDTRIGKKHVTKIFEMDYKKRTLTITRIKKKKKSIRVKPIPPGTIYDDPLTAFYNFRYGSYGPAAFGKSYTIDTIPGKKVKHISLRIATKEETMKRKSHFPLHNKAKFLIYLRIAPDIVKSKRGEIEGWVSSELIPLYGIAKDVLFFGDVEGKLLGYGRYPTPSPPL